MVSCRDCRQKFGVTKTRYHCSVCGTAVCSSCSNKDLLVYVPDEEEKGDEKTVTLAIIKIVGVRTFLNLALSNTDTVSLCRP